MWRGCGASHQSVTSTHRFCRRTAVQDFDFPVMLHEVTEAFFSGSADLVGGEMGEAMRRIVANPGDAQAAAILARQPGYNSRLRTTCVATLLSGGHAQNALPQLAEATVNCRVFPTHDPRACGHGFR